MARGVRRVGASILGALCLTAVAATSGAEPTAAQKDAASPTTLAAAAADPDCHNPPPGPTSGLPPMMCVPGNPNAGFYNNWVTRNGIDFDQIQTLDKQAKIKISLPPEDVLTNLQVCTRIGATWARGTPCPMADTRGYQIPSFPGVVFTGGYADAWVKSPPGSATEFGVFQPFEVHMVAFGTIPVSATVHLQQTMHNGLLDPLKFDWLQAQTEIPDGTDIPGYGPPPHPHDPLGLDNRFAYPAETAGPVTIRLTDVRVDGVPVAIGDRCMTGVTTLNLKSVGGYYNAHDQVVGDIPAGQPGSFSPAITPPSYLGGSIDIPAFHGCGVDGDDLSPLITKMVSGPDNPITAENKTILYGWCVGGGGHVGGQEDSLCSPPQAVGLRSALVPRVTEKSDTDVLALIPKNILNQMTPEDKRIVAASLQGKLPGE